MKGQEDSEMLVIRAQAGDREALSRVLEWLQPGLRRYLRAIAGTTASDDLAQDTLIVVYQKLEWLEDPSAFRAWAYKIAHRLALKELRRQSRFEHLDEDWAMQTNKSSRNLHETFNWGIDLEAAIVNLPTATRAVLTLRYGADLAIAEIASALEIPAGTVKSRLAYGLNSLRKTFRRSDGSRRSED